MVRVLNFHNKELNPTTPSRARRMVEKGKAKKYWDNSGFYIKLTYDPPTLVDKD